MLRNLVISKRRALLFTAAAILLGAGFLYWNSLSMMPSILPGYPGDAFFPRIVLAIIVLFAALVLLGALRRQAEPTADLAAPPPDEVRLDFRELATVAVLAFGYVALLRPLGFEIVTFAFLFVLLERRLMMPAARRLPVAAVAALIAMFVIYAIFIVGLRVFMPLRFLPSYISF